MADRLPYMPAFVEDWLRSETVAGMSFECRGLYWHLLCLSWNSDGLTTDTEALRRLAGADRDEWERAWPKVAACFVERGGRLYNEKLEAVRADVDAARDAQATGQTVKAEVGRIGGLRSVATRRQRYGSAQPQRRSTTEALPEPLTEVASRLLREQPAEAAEATPEVAPKRLPNFRDQSTDPDPEAPTTTDRDLRDPGAATAASSVVVGDDWTQSLTAGQLRQASHELLALWAQHAPTAAVRPSIERLQVRGKRDLVSALRTRSLDDWEGIFRAVGASDYLAGRLGDEPITLWKVLDLADRIEAGEFKNHDRVVRSLPALVAVEAAPWTPPVASDRQAATWAAPEVACVGGAQ